MDFYKEDIKHDTEYKNKCNATECIDLKVSCRYRLMRKYCGQDYTPYHNKDKGCCEFAIKFRVQERQQLRL